MKEKLIGLKYSLPLIVLFIGIDVILKFFEKEFLAKHIDTEVVFNCNTILFIVGILSVVLLTNAFKKANPNAGFRMQLLAIIVKLFILGVAAFVYISVAKPYNAMAIYASMLLYALYSYIEVRIILKLKRLYA